MLRSRTQWWGTVLEAPSAPELAAFYHRLLGWPLVKEHPAWAVLEAPGGSSYLAFQTDVDYRPPTWPSVDGAQQMQLHLDVEVDDLEQAVSYAVEVGATLADYQPQEHVRVMLDPAGHPFCLYLDEPD